MKKLLTLGGATQDIFIVQEHPQMIDAELYGKTEHCLAFREGEKIEVKSLDYHTGGGATNSATSFARLGFKTSCCIRVGDDLYGKQIIKELAQHGIMVYELLDPEGATGVSFILPTTSHDRVVLAWRGANADLQYKDLPHDLFDTVDALYLTSLSGNSAHAFLPIVQQAKKKGVVVMANPGTSQLNAGANYLVQSLSYLDVLIMNAHEAQLCMQGVAAAKHVELAEMPFEHHPVPQEYPALFQSSYGYNLRHFLKRIFNVGPTIIAITNGAEGVYVATRETLLFHPSLPTKVVSTLGAGDAFGSCFAAGVMQNKDLKSATLHALLNAKSVIEHRGAKAGLLTEEQLEQAYQKLMREYADQFMAFEL